MGTLLQASTGTTVTSHALNAVGWFLSCLFICYFFCPMLFRGISFLSKRIKNYELCGLFFCVAFIVGVSRLAIYIQENLSIGKLSFNDIEYGSPYVRIWYIALGMFLGAIYLKYKDVLRINISVANVIECAMVILIVALLYIHCFVTFTWMWVTVVNIIIPMLTIMVFSFEKGIVSKALAIDTFFGLGKRSNLVYLWHFPVVIYVELLFVSCYQLSFGWKICGVLLSTVMVVFVVWGVEKISQHKSIAEK